MSCHWNIQVEKYILDNGLQHSITKLTTGQCPQAPYLHVFKYHQRGDSAPSPRQPVLMPKNPCVEEIFPNVQFKLPLVQLDAISSCSLAYYLGEEAEPHVTTTSFQAAVGNKHPHAFTSCQWQYSVYGEGWGPPLTLLSLRRTGSSSLRHRLWDLQIHRYTANRCFSLT